MALRGGRSRVECCSVEKSDLFFAVTATLKIDVQQERNQGSEFLWEALAALTRTEKKSAAMPSAIRLIQTLACPLNHDVFISLRKCLETSQDLKRWIYSKVLSVNQFAVW